MSEEKKKKKKKKGPLSEQAKSMVKWTEQDWGTKSGKNSIVGKNATGERYLPKAKLASLSDAEYAATTKKKRDAIKKGKQYSKNTKAAVVTASRGRKIGGK